MARDIKDIKEKAEAFLKENRERYSHKSSSLFSECAKSLESDILSYISLTKDPETLRDYLNGKKALPYPWPQERPGCEDLFDEEVSEILFKEIRKSACEENCYFSREALCGMFSSLERNLDASYPNHKSLWLENKKAVRSFAAGHCFTPGIKGKAQSLSDIFLFLDSCILSPEKRAEYKKASEGNLLEDKDILTGKGCCEKYFGKDLEDDVSLLSERYAVTKDTARAAVFAVNQASSPIKSPEDFISFFSDVGKRLFLRVDDAVTVTYEKGGLLKRDFYRADPEEFINAAVWMLNTSSPERYPHAKVFPDNDVSAFISDMGKGYKKGSLSFFKDILRASASSFLKEEVKDIPSMYAFSETLPDRNFGYACDMFSDDDDNLSSYFAEMTVREGTPEDLAFFVRDVENVYAEESPVFPSSGKISTLFEIPKEARPHFFESVKAFMSSGFTFCREDTVNALKMFNAPRLHLDADISERDLLFIETEILDMSLDTGYYPQTSDIEIFSEMFGKVNRVLKKKGLSLTEEERDALRSRILTDSEKCVRREYVLSSASVTGSSDEEVFGFIEEALKSL